MAQVRRSQTGWSRGAMVAVALAAAASLGGCAGASDFAGASAPYQVAGPVVDKAPVQNQGCVYSTLSFVDDCSPFPHYYGP